jgi:dienelactone hydrolase
MRALSRKMMAPMVAALVVMGGATACEPYVHTYITDIGEVRDPADAPARYVDEVFPGVTVTSNIAWGEAPNRAGTPVPLALDLYEPAGDTIARRPALVVAHSGGFKVGSKTNAVSVDLANRFARKGYVVISIDYRKLALVDCGTLGGAVSDASGCKYAAMAATSDGQAAVRWLRANADTYRIDPTRIAMMGDSAGALISILTGMLADTPGNPDDPVAIETMAGAPENTGNPGYSSEIQAWSSISGGLPPTETPTLGAKLAAAETTTAPGYLFAATQDNQTPYQWSVDVRDVLVSIGRTVAFKSVVGGHVPYSTYKTLFNEQSTRFFYLALRLSAAEQ